MTEPICGLDNSWHSPVNTRNFAIDFDDTITADPEVIAALVHAGKKKGHRFYCVTARRSTEENEGIVNEVLDKYDIQMPIIFTNLGSKLQAVADRGIVIDIWMDDSPMTLVHGR